MKDYIELQTWKYGNYYILYKVGVEAIYPSVFVY